MVVVGSKHSGGRDNGSYYGPCQSYVCSWMDGMAVGHLAMGGGQRGVNCPCQVGMGKFCKRGFSREWEPWWLTRLVSAGCLMVMVLVMAVPEI